MPNVFDLLEKIRRRPELYLGEDEHRRDVQLRNLENLLNGYGLAISHHGLEDPGSDFVHAFAQWLWRTHGWSGSAGPVAAVRGATGSATEAWELFWRMIDEFRETQE